MSDPTGDVRLVGTLLGQAMSEGLRLLEELHAAEARMERAETELATSKERVTVLRDRYGRNGDLAKSMWATLRDELVDRIPVIEDGHKGDKKVDIPVSTHG